MPRPHPIDGTARLELTLPRAEFATLEVFDAAGRRVARPFVGALPPGATSLTWRAEDADGRRLRPGLYLLSLRSGAERAVQRVVVAW